MPSYAQHRGYPVGDIGVDWKICNSGSDLDNGQESGAEGELVQDSEEITVGAYILVNWDDDDADGDMDKDGNWNRLPIPDVGENSVGDEDNLAKFIPTIQPLLNVGIIELTVSDVDADKIKLWWYRTKGTPLLLNSSKIIWNLANPGDRLNFQYFMQNGFWVEGTKPGTCERGATFTLRYTSDTGASVQKQCKATIVMIRLGNAVYRENMVGMANAYPLRERGHGGLAFSFDGPATAANLKNRDKYGIVQMQGLDPEGEKLGGVFGVSGFEYWYCYTHTGEITDDEDGYTKRLKILKIAYWACEYWDTSFNYAAFDCMTPFGADWDGKLTDIAEMRCDGIIELAYEFNGIMVWGQITDCGGAHYDMRINSYLNEHNNWQWGDDPADWDWDMYATCLPATQGGFADQYLTEHNPTYSGGSFRGRDWETTFQEQRLVWPESLSPERHTH